MPVLNELKQKITSGEYDDRFRRVYVTDSEVAAQHARYCKLAETFAE